VKEREAHAARLLVRDSATSYDHAAAASRKIGRRRKEGSQKFHPGTNLTRDTRLGCYSRQACGESGRRVRVGLQPVCLCLAAAVEGAYQPAWWCMHGEEETTSVTSPATHLAARAARADKDPAYVYGSYVVSKPICQPAAGGK
jgi:hypothetical protein